MVMLFTKGQFISNKEHDSAWAEMYTKYPDVAHELRRKLFTQKFPNVSIDFQYPTLVPFRDNKYDRYHRRHVKIPATFNEDVERLLGTDQFNLYSVLGDLVTTKGQISDEHKTRLQEVQRTLEVLSELLASLPSYDALFVESLPACKVESAAEAVWAVANATETEETAVSYVEGINGEASGAYEVQPSDLPAHLTIVSRCLVEFVDEVLLLLDEESFAFIERDTSI